APRAARSVELWETGSSCEHIARAANGMEQRLVETFLELAPQAADVNVDNIGARVEMIIPHLLEQHCAGHHPALVAGEIFEKQIFARLQLDLLAGAADAS